MRRLRRDALSGIATAHSPAPHRTAATRCTCAAPASAAIGWITPISLLTSIAATSPGRMALVRHVEVDCAVGPDRKGTFITRPGPVPTAATVSSTAARSVDSVTIAPVPLIAQLRLGRAAGERDPAT